MGSRSGIHSVAVHRSFVEDQRISQLQAVMDAAAQWHRLDDDVALLHRIADTTRLHC